MIGRYAKSTIKNHSTVSKYLNELISLKINNLDEETKNIAYLFKEGSWLILIQIDSKKYWYYSSTKYDIIKTINSLRIYQRGVSIMKIFICHSRYYGRLELWLFDACTKFTGYVKN